MFGHQFHYHYVGRPTKSVVIVVRGLINRSFVMIWHDKCLKRYLLFFFSGLFKLLHFHFTNLTKNRDFLMMFYVNSCKLVFIYILLLRNDEEQCIKYLLCNEVENKTKHITKLLS